MSRSYAQSKLAERRGRAGAEASARSPKRQWPLRKITGETMEPLAGTAIEMRRQVLECGHTIGIPHDFIGETYPARRRCGKCFKAQIGA